MVKPELTIRYICEICGEKHSTIDGALKCEAIGKPVPKYKIGDIVTVLTGDGSGRQAKVKRVFYYSPSWGGKKYAHKVGYEADLIGTWGTRQLIEDESV